MIIFYKDHILISSCSKKNIPRWNVIVKHLQTSLDSAWLYKVSVCNNARATEPCYRAALRELQLADTTICSISYHQRQRR